MNLKQLSIISLISATCLINSYGQVERHALSFNISVDESMKDHFKPDGRLLIYFCKNAEAWPIGTFLIDAKACIFGKTYTGWNKDKALKIEGSEGWFTYQTNGFLLEDDPEQGWIVLPEWGFDNVPAAKYYIQVKWGQNHGREELLWGSGNLYSEKVEVELNNDTEVDLVISERFPYNPLVKHELIKEVVIQSDTLTRWWGKPIYLKAAVLLPAKYYNNPEKAYPILYEVSEQHTLLNYFWYTEKLKDWWSTEDAPGIICVFPDHMGADTKHWLMNSENKGPYAYAFLHELIPYIENEYRNTLSADTRFLTGFSEGGLSALTLQIMYPDMFNGVASYAPDPVTFNKYVLVDIYQDKNFFIGKTGLPQPLWRDTNGEVQVTMKNFIDYFRVFSTANSCYNTGTGFGSLNATISPKGPDGQPMQLIDEETGKINHEVAQHWKKYDLLNICKTNWVELGPKLQGKIYIEVGDMDSPYLNVSVREMEKFMKETENPKSDAVFNFIPMAGHFREGVIMQARIEKIAERLAEIETK